MDDFIAEFRPRARPLPVVEYSEGFVAEFRPRRNLPVIEQCDDDCLKVSQDPCPTDPPMEYTDKDLINALSEKNFSKESITHLLENSIIQLVEKLLINRSILRIHGGVQVVLDDDDSPISLDLNRTFTKTAHKDRDLSTELDPTGFNVKLREELLARESESRRLGMGVDGEENMLGPGCQQVGAVSPPMEVCGFRDDDVRPLCSPPYEPDSSSLMSPAACDTRNSLSVSEAKKRRRDSDDESGYTSKDDLDTQVEEASEKTSKRKDASKTHSVFNEYYCNGFDGKETLHDPDGDRLGEHSVSSVEGSDEMDDDEEDDDSAHESRLVIDENPERAPAAENPCMEVEDTCISVKSAPHRNNETLRSSEHFRNKTLTDYSESEELESLLSSDITDVDTDAPVDLSGDSDLSRGGLSVLPHPLSLVTKVQDGLKCKQCSAVLPHGQAVSEHALTMHNLFSCSFCFRTFTAKNNLKRHVRLHTGSRPYKCSQCPQTFARRDDLKGHVLRHDYSKPFRCSICHKGYTDRACVKNHMAKEHRSRLMHVCPTCGESFDRDESFYAAQAVSPSSSSSSPARSAPSSAPTT
ncbi:hypothetical protein Btru_055522 [Bulinus truncatus]|nr:hypothetical protein Btru_055522 [Bulinus truncatus]